MVGKVRIGYIQVLTYASLHLRAAELAASATAELPYLPRIFLTDIHTLK